MTECECGRCSPTHHLPYVGVGKGHTQKEGLQLLFLFVAFLHRHSKLFRKFSFIELSSDRLSYFIYCSCLYGYVACMNVHILGSQKTSNCMDLEL